MYNVQSWTDTVLLALSNSLTQFLNFLPKLVGAIVIFVIGLLIASLIKTLVMRLLTMAQLEPFAERVGLNKVLRGIGASISAQEVLGEIIRWAIIFIFLVPASEVLGLPQLSNLINGLVDYIPNVIVAVVVVMVGAIVADILGELVGSTSHAIGASTANVLSVIAKYSVIVFAIMIALSELGIASRIIETIITGIVVMFALAGGLAFGLGGKDTATDILNSVKRNLQEKR
jgi:small-conductance mechanosensitive channel